MSNNEFTTDGQSETHRETAPMRSEEAPDNGSDQRYTNTIPDVQSPRRHRGVTQDGIGEIFQKESTLNQLKSALIIFISTGFGVGFVGFSVIGSAEIQGAIASTSIIALALIGPVLGVLTGIRTGNALDQEPAIQAYATTVVSTISGYSLYFITASVLVAANTATSFAVGDFLAPMVIAAIGTAIPGTAAVYTVQELRSIS